MKHAYKDFNLYPDEVFRTQGKDTYFTYQNTGTATGTVKGSNDAITWFTIAIIAAGGIVQRVHSYLYIKLEGSTEIKGSRGTLSGFSVQNYTIEELPLATTL